MGGELREGLELLLDAAVAAEPHADGIVESGGRVEQVHGRRV
jgi:hypothetical protein